MREVVVFEGQSLLDLALQELGSIAAVFDLADANGLSVTDLLTAGQVLVIPASDAGLPALVECYQRLAYRVNTGDTPQTAPTTTTQRFFSSQFFKPDYFA